MSATLDAPLVAAPLATAEQLAQVRVPTTRRYLMCRPEYFTVEYSINPWMDPERPVDTRLAVAQWTALKDAYESLGHKVELIDPEPGLPDMVFAANSGTVIDGIVLGARFRAEQRAAEADHFRRWFLSNGYRDVVMPGCVNEAEGDFTWTGTVLLAGTGFRTDPGAHAEAQEVLGVPVVSLRLVDPRYYHLDTALFVLDDRSTRPEICYYPAAFSPGLSGFSVACSPTPSSPPTPTPNASASTASPTATTSCCPRRPPTSAAVSPPVATSPCTSTSRSCASPAAAPSAAPWSSGLIGGFPASRISSVPGRRVWPTGVRRGPPAPRFVFEYRHESGGPHFAGTLERLTEYSPSVPVCGPTARGRTDAC